MDKTYKFEVKSLNDRKYIVRILNIIERKYKILEQHESVAIVNYFRKKIVNDNPPYFVDFTKDEILLFNRVINDATNVSALRNYDDFDGVKYSDVGIDLMNRIANTIKGEN